MKRFRFSLESVLAVREAKVDQAEAALAERERSCRELRERLMRCRDAEMQILAELAMGQESAAEQPILPVRRAYLLSVKEQIKMLDARLAAEQAEIIRLRRVLLERSKEEQVIEHLKKRQIKAFRSTVDREQQAEIDEIAGGRWASNSSRRFE